MPLLTADDNSFLKQFFERLLELHASGAVTTESAVDYLMRAIGAVDLQKADAIQYLHSMLEDAWREDDA
jgi:hypothetical protein